MNTNTQKQAAKAFVQEWSGKGYEKGETQRFWLSLLHNVFGIDDPIKVSINQFYGIEINDFACSVAQTALWIAESQMMQETDEIVGLSLDPLPLKTYTNIHEGNALRMDWNEVVPAAELDYIMGNPPFIGHQWRSLSQVEDMDTVFAEWDKYGKLDYVAAWYKKAVEYIGHNPILTAFVSTNSLVQGESVATLWKPLFEKYGVEILFAYRTFVWNSEATDKAHVHCIIIGFSTYHSERKRRIYDGDSSTVASNINGYLLDAPSVFIQNRGTSYSQIYQFGRLHSEQNALLLVAQRCFTVRIPQCSTDYGAH
ncbi:MAG: hypothetical protein J6O51_09355 [Bacteroidales bacterium]|nr:hypothetical protein [Bacteroidales bacterium]